MATREQVKAKCLELLENGRDRIEERIDHYINCGALGISEAPDDFILPRIIVSVVLEENADQIIWDRKKYKKIINNLKCF
jgi:hypothetical protein